MATCKALLAFVISESMRLPHLNSGNGCIVLIDLPAAMRAVSTIGHNVRLRAKRILRLASFCPIILWRRFEEQLKTESDICRRKLLEGLMVLEREKLRSISASAR